MRTVAIGDIHGCSRALDLLLEAIDPQSDDLIVTLGDYVDRGSNSKGVIDRLLDLRKRCRVVSIKGNHDLMMVEARDGAEPFRQWIACGGQQTLASYLRNGEYTSLTDAVPAEHWRFIEQDCLPYFETDTHFFVHASVHADLALADQAHEMLYWEKLTEATWRPHESGKTMICGHTVQRSGRPLVLERAVCIDTFVYGNGWLTGLDIESEIYWQANERGETRVGNLDFRGLRFRY